MARFRIILIITIWQCYTCALIEDFNINASVHWKKISDSIYPDGHSMSLFTVVPSKESGQGVLITVLLPCLHNASFAGIVKSVSLDITNYKEVVLNVRNIGQYNGYEFFLKHNGDFGDSVPSYVTYFEAPKTDFAQVKLPLSGFKAYQKGRPVPNAQQLNTKNITSIGILAYGGSHRPVKQTGMAILQIDWIKME